MKSLFLAVFTLVSILSSSHVFAEYCPSSAKINAESQLAVDNLQILDEEVNSLYPQSSFIVIADINTVKAVLMSVNRMSDQNYNTCLNIKTVFYTINFSIFNLSENLKDIMSQDHNSPLKAHLDTFLTSFITLEKTIESSPGRYIVPRGPFYRRFFPGYGTGTRFGPRRNPRGRYNNPRRGYRRNQDRDSRRFNPSRNPNTNPNVNPRGNSRRDSRKDPRRNP